MINWAKTKERFGYDHPIRVRIKVVAVCDDCGKEVDKCLTRLGDVDGDKYPFKCRSCWCKMYAPEWSARLKAYYATPEGKSRASNRAKSGWKNHRDKMMEANKAGKAKRSKTMKAVWADPEKRDAYVESLNRQETKEKMSENSLKLWQDPEYRNKIIPGMSERAKANWGDPEYRQKVIEALTGNEKSIAAGKAMWENPEYWAKMAAQSKANWARPEYREAHVNAAKAQWSDPEFRKAGLEQLERIRNDPKLIADRKAKLSILMKTKWQDPEFADRIITSLNRPEVLKKIGEASRRVWANPEYREKRKSIRNDPRGHLSSYQVKLYSMLDDLGVKYYREYEGAPADPQCKVGPWNMDCVVPREGRPALIIECNGFWHNLRQIRVKDKSKATYVSKYLADKYELKYIWDHEFKNFKKVIDLLKYWLGISEIKAIDYDLDGVTIKPCPADDYKLLLGKYHYFPNAGMGGIAFGAYIENELIAVNIFSPVKGAVGDYTEGQVRELSRYCVNPKYDRPEIGPLLIKSSIERLMPWYKCIVAYTDLTFNNIDGLLRATGFSEIGEVAPDTWFIDGGGDSFRGLGEACVDPLYDGK